MSTAFFLGAGASKPFGLPTVMEFFDRVNWDREGKGKGYRSATEELARRIWITRGMNGASPFPKFDSEWLFEDLQKIVDTEPLRGDTYSGWNISFCTPQDLLIFLKREIIHVFRTIVSPSTLYLPLVKRLNEEVGIQGPLKIFTTNYDLLIESFFRGLNRNKLDVQFIDGFKRLNEYESREWSVEEYQSPPIEGKLRIELYKLHGSITWKWDTIKGKVVDLDWQQPTDYDRLLYLGYKGVPELIPGDPFGFLYQELTSALCQYELFVIIGFRFNDAYIRGLFSWALKFNNLLKTIVVIPNKTELHDEVKSWTYPNIDFLELRFGENDFTDRLLDKIKK